MDIIFCSITKQNNFYNTKLGKSDFTQQNKELFYCETNNNNKKGLSQFYNECLIKFKDKDCIIFCHDDVELISYDIIEQVKKGFKSYDVLGVAGCVNPKIIEKNLWHWMAGDRSNMRGFAGHSAANNNFLITSFGDTPDRVAILDGVFLAVNVKSINGKNVRFDEQFKFHHYDIDFSLTCNANKLKLGVWPFLINHSSPGLREFHQDWVNSNQKFIDKWKNK